MVTSQQLHPGMTLSIRGKLYRVESCVKVTVPKGTPFVKTRLKELTSDKTIEKNFKLNQTVKDVALIERNLEFLYPEGKHYLFLDIDTLEQILVPMDVIGERINFLKESVQLAAAFYGDMVFSVDLPQFLELMVVSVAEEEGKRQVVNVNKNAVLETGAVIGVPRFIEAGDIVKVDTRTGEFIQRV